MDTNRILVAHDKHGIRLAADPDPPILLHLLDNNLLQRSIVVLEFLRPEAPEHGLPLKRERTRLLKLVVVKQHRVKAGHEEKVAAVHDVLLTDGIRAGRPKFRASRVDQVPGLARVIPVGPHVREEHLVDELPDQRLEDAPGCGEAVIVRQGDGVCHRRELVPVRVKVLLQGLLPAHVVPLSVEL